MALKVRNGGVRRTPEQLGHVSNKRELVTINYKTNKGIDVTLGQRPTPRFTAFVSLYFPKLSKAIENDKQFNITVNGKKVGDAEIFKESEDSLNVVWVGIDDSERGQGYASAAMKGIIKYAKGAGFKHVTLEVPGISPDARHIYEKLGFEAGNLISDINDAWGGLTEMKLNL